ncbi:Exodeoxyribonuclease VII small subunit [Fontimonas thermophila]|uniref:Exodeoxyribonuclease 7 small subunit n=1 Tax=Fontimonas thermophila TaxID=1076937 RepID=A0A1I2IDX6_9GAMM|nr:exodeoxyribonuclease VII small subunit [Fontimonas thermophila]SFF40549.1 Exodeoxyribonuclease VII small subunit [Fontimonas thermophila]
MTRPPDPAADGDDAVSRFEEAIKELEGIVQRLERGELRLDEALALFERGVELARQCRSALATAELRVHNLLDESTAQDDEP